MFRFAILILFFCSGLSALIYEVVWLRLLHNQFGTTIYAVSTVLAAFMGGLALGSFLFGRIADRTRNTLLLYGFLELGIGIAAFALPGLLYLLNPLYEMGYESLLPSFFLLSLVRFALTFPVLLIPTTLMGATLPVLSKYLVREKGKLGLNVGILYALNTLGAVVGCFLAGFFLIAFLGVRGSTLLAVLINVIVAVVAITLSQSTRIAAAEQKITEKNTLPEMEKNATKLPRAVRVTLFVYMVSGFVALAYQVVWFRSLVFAFDKMKNTTYAFTAMLTVFLIGLALGSAFATRFVDKEKNPVRLFAFIEVLIGLAGTLSFFVIHFKTPGLMLFNDFNEATQNIIWTAGVANVFYQTAISILLPTFLMGVAFPVAARICVPDLDRVGLGVGRLYALNTLGAIFGAFAAGFLLIPFLGLARSILLLAVVNVILGIIIIAVTESITARNKQIYATIGVFIILVLVIRIPTRAQFHNVERPSQMLFYKEGPLATVSVVSNALRHKTIYVDKVGVAGTDPVLMTDQKSLAHLPMLLLEKPRSVLTVGFGSGGASYSYSLYPELEEIHCVEICPAVLDAAPYLREANEGILQKDDSRYKVIIEDARSYMRYCDRTYDIIATDCTDLRYKSNANLYDYEYFKICRERLSDDGIVVVWTPLAGLSEKAFKVVLRTFLKVFPQMTVWYMNNEATHYILLTGTKKQIKINYPLFLEKISREDIAADLAKVHLEDPYKLLSCFVTNNSQLGKFLSGSSINTEDIPYLEFETPKYGYGEKPLHDNLRALMDISAPIKAHIPDKSDKKTVTDNLVPFLKANSYILQGHLSKRELEFGKACELYMKAYSINPRDSSLKHNLDFPDLVRRKTVNPQDWWARNSLGYLYYLQQRYSDAITVLNPLAVLEWNDNTPQDLRRFIFEANVHIAHSYIDAGQQDRAREYIENLEILKPGSDKYILLMDKIQPAQEPHNENTDPQS